MEIKSYRMKIDTSFRICNIKSKHRINAKITFCNFSNYICYKKEILNFSYE